MIIPLDKFNEFFEENKDVLELKVDTYPINEENFDK